MELEIKPLDCADDDPSFVIIEEWESHELAHDQALRALARRAADSPVYVGSTLSPIWRQLRLLGTEVEKHHPPFVATRSGRDA